MKSADTSLESEKRKIIYQFRVAGGVSLATLIMGAFFYHHVEKMDWIDAVYFCVITLTTIGYGDIVPKTDFGKLFTVFYVIIGVGIIATFVNLTVKRSVVLHRKK